MLIFGKSWLWKYSVHCRFLLTFLYVGNLSKQKNEMLFAATWLDLEIIILSEVSKAEEDKYHMILLICGI